MSKLTPSKISIVAVEDDAAQARLLSRALAYFENADTELHVYSDPVAAYSHVSAKWVDIVITDLDMPEVDGLAIVRQAKKFNPWVQSLVITAYSTSTALVSAGDIGAADYLVKPVSEEEIQELVSLAIARLRRWTKSLSLTLGRTTNAV